MPKYNPSEIEPKWNEIWEKSLINEAKNGDKRPKYYCLDMFPYPSGSGLHVGHWRGYVLSDVAARVKKIEGFNVLHPMGWDAFGSPAENDAIKKGIHPKKNVDENIDAIRSQLKQIGACYDWEREVNTTDPDYYKWTQWAFIQMFKKGLAYKKEMPINWCPSCKTGLSNEDVAGGSCERCGTEASKKNLNQWMIKITDYADRLLSDLDKLTEWPEKVRKMQADWIGRSEGTSIKFKVANIKEDFFIEVFTTRADTLFGCTYVVMAPECHYVEHLKPYIKNWNEVENYGNEAKKKSSIERMSETEKEKTGVRLEGIKAINPINGREVEVFVTDYVIADYGTGAVMAVPEHDERDFLFAKKYEIEIIQSIAPIVTYQKTPPVEGLEYVARDMVEVIVYNPRTDKYLCLKWKKQPWTTFITGGIEKGETPTESAEREILEETGYKNVKLKKILGNTRAIFHAAHKNENRVTNATGLLYELLNDENIGISDEESNIHEIIWLNREDLIPETMVCASLDYWLRGVDGKETAFTDYGILVNSGEFTGLTSEEGAKKITEKLKSEGLGDFVVNYHLRDWVFARQRYWGEPIPIVDCPKCGLQPLDEKDLPLLLPEVEKYEPTGTGESPLAALTDWVNTTCPKCGGPAKRETDTMPQWAGSCWYFLRYADPKNKKELASPESLKYWLPVDLYVGGIEHAVLHLLYSRFWTKFLYDIKVVEFDEPFTRLFNQGMVYKLGAKMSKSKGNVVSPDDMISKYSADSLRAYELFMAPPEQDAEWNDSGVPGVFRFLNKVWDLGQEIAERVGEADSQKLLTESFEIGETELEVATHKTIKKFNEALESFRYNTLISTLMEFTNYLQTKKDLLYTQPQPFLILILLLSPIAPHISEELWEQFGFSESIFSGHYFWPKHDPEKIKEDIVNIIVQENGKFRGNIEVPADSNEEEVLKICDNSPKLAAIREGSKKVVYVKNRLINFVK